MRAEDQADSGHEAERENEICYDEMNGHSEAQKQKLLLIVPNGGSRQMLGVPELAEHSSVLLTSRTKCLAHYTVFVEVSPSLPMQVLSLRRQPIFIY
jgi:hypothetical protein